MATRISFPFTQKQAFEALIALVRGEDFSYKAVDKDGVETLVTPDADKIVEFLTHKIAQVEKRSDAPKKLTPQQVKNEGVKAAILDSMEPGVAYSIPDMLGQFDCFEPDTRSQYVSALLTQLKNAGKIVRSEDKGKAYFTLAPIEG